MNPENCLISHEIDVCKLASLVAGRGWCHDGMDVGGAVGGVESGLEKIYFS